MYNQNVMKEFARAETLCTFGSLLTLFKEGVTILYSH